MCCRYILILLFCLSGWNTFAQTPDSTQNYIYWSEDYRLVWTDFEELPDRHSKHSAYSVVGHLSELQMTEAYFNSTIRTFFDPYKSWARNWVPILLAHEQGHFDLAELYARKLRKEVQQAMIEGTLTVESFEKMTKDIDQELKQAHNEYDNATEYSLKYRSQMKWNELIREQLLEYDAYKNPEIEARK